MKQIIDAIEGNKGVRIDLYTLNRTSEDRVKKVLALFLKKHDCTELLKPVYTCLKELIINALRANYKSLYFENFNSGSTERLLDKEKAQQLFQLEMTRDEARNIARIARANNIKIEIRIGMTGHMLKLEVTNPISIDAMELNAVRKKITDAGKSADITRFFQDNPADPGRDADGLGLVMISIILRNLGIDPSPLNISSQGGVTSAEMVIPITPAVLKRYHKIVNEPLSR